MLLKSKRYPTDLVYRESNLLSPSQLHVKSIIRFMSKSHYYRDILNHGINTRNAAENNLTLQNLKHSVCMNHIYYIIQNIFNLLPQNIRVKLYHLIKKDIIKCIIESNYKVTIMV